MQTGRDRARAYGGTEDGREGKELPRGSEVGRSWARPEVEDDSYRASARGVRRACAQTATKGRPGDTHGPRTAAFRCPRCPITVLAPGSAARSPEPTGDRPGLSSKGGRRGWEMQQYQGNKECFLQSAADQKTSLLSYISSNPYILNRKTNTKAVIPSQACGNFPRGNVSRRPR